jgi:hypothetical protein
MRRDGKPEASGISGDRAAAGLETGSLRSLSNRANWKRGAALQLKDPIGGRGAELGLWPNHRARYRPLFLMSNQADMPKPWR